MTTDDRDATDDLDDRLNLEAAREILGRDEPATAPLHAFARDIIANLQPAGFAPVPYVWLRPDIGTPDERADVEARYRAEQLATYWGMTP